MSDLHPIVPSTDDLIAKLRRRAEEAAAKAAPAPVNQDNRPQGEEVARRANRRESAGV